MEDLTNDINSIKDKLISFRRDFHIHPELAFKEERTASIIANELEQLGWEVSRGVAKTGVVGLLKGTEGSKTVMIRVDIDALPITEPEGKPYRSQNPGIMHACGHDGHAAVGLAVAELLANRKNTLKGNVKLVFQPAEEIMSGAREMIAEGVMDNPKVDHVLSIHLWSGLPVGVIAAQPGPIFSSADEISIVFKGKGGHGGMPHLSIDPILIACNAVTTLQTILSREIPPSQPAVLGFGTINGGTAFNVVSDSVALTGTIRTLDDSVRSFILERAEHIATTVAMSLRGEAEFKHVRGAPPVINDKSVSDVVSKVAVEIVGEKNTQTIVPPQVGDDATFFLREAPGCYFLVGCANPDLGITASHHSPEFDIDEESLPIAANILCQSALNYIS